MALVRDAAYWQRIHELAAKAPRPTDAALDMLRRNGCPSRRSEDERQAS